MEKLISIIIPVYNTGKCLQKCLDSVLCQTYKKLEIILVNDGSSDESATICDEYALKDSRIEVIHKQNGGVSSARNAGLDIAQGEYIGFVDADDFVVPEMFEKLVKEIEKGYDVVQCGYVLLYGDSMVSAKTLTHFRDEYVGKTEILKAFFEEKIINSLWNKLFVRSVMEGKKFDESIRIAEDKLFLHECLVDAKNVKCIPDELYVYVQRDASATNASLSEKHFDDVKILDYFVEKYRFSDEMSSSLMINAAKVYLSLLFRIVCSDEANGIEEEYRDKVLKFKKVILNSELFNKKEKIITQMLSLAPRIAYKIITLYLKNKY